MKVLKKSLKIVGMTLAVLILVLVLLTIYNHLALKQEANQLTPNGQLVDVEGCKLHVYSEGESTESPPLVFLSGSATVAPVYDFKPLFSLLSDEYKGQRGKEDGMKCVLPVLLVASCVSWHIKSLLVWKHPCCDWC